MKTVTSIVAVAALALSAAPGAAGCGSPETVPEEDVTDQATEAIWPHTVVGNWLVQIRDARTSDGWVVLPDQDEVMVAHGDGSTSILPFDQGFGSYGAFPRTLADTPNAVGGIGTWQWVNNSVVRTTFLRFLYVPKDFKENANNAQDRLGYIRGEFVGTFNGGQIVGELALQIISVNPDYCPRGKAPCIMQPKQGGVVRAYAKMTKFNPIDGPVLPRYRNEEVGRLPYGWLEER